MQKTSSALQSLRQQGSSSRTSAPLLCCGKCHHMLPFQNSTDFDLCFKHCQIVVSSQDPFGIGNNTNRLYIPILKRATSTPEDCHNCRTHLHSYQIIGALQIVMSVYSTRRYVRSAQMLISEKSQVPQTFNTSYSS